MNKLNDEQKKIVNNNLNLVYFVINRLRLKVNEDIVQEGYLALCKAALNYNKDKSKFSTFAYNYIKNTIIQYINYNNIIKPKRQKGKFEYADINEYNDELLYRDAESSIYEVIYDIYYEKFFSLLDETEKIIIQKKIEKYTIGEIAKELKRTPRTIYNKIYNIKNKFEIFKKGIEQ